jgi:hypothetical protein
MLDSPLAWWIAGPVLGLVIVGFFGLANKRFGVLGGVTDLVHGSSEGKGLGSWRALLVVGIVLGGAAYALLAGAPDAGGGYSWLDARLSLGGEVAALFGAGLAIGVGAARARPVAAPPATASPAPRSSRPRASSRWGRSWRPRSRPPSR